MSQIKYARPDNILFRIFVLLLIWMTVPVFNYAQVNCTAHFSYTSTNLTSTVQFQAAMNNVSIPVSYTWDFGDGTTGSTANPTHTYPGPGAYFACLTVNLSNSTGIICTAHYCDTVRIAGTPGCNAQFAVQPGTVNGTFHFAPAPNPAGTSYSWNFGDGTNSTMMAPNHTYTTPGHYLVCLTVTYGTSSQLLCTATWCDSVFVPGNQPLCDAHFTFTASSATGGFQFSPAPNTQYTSYLWDFGDGSTSTMMNPFHQYNNPGNYLVCLTVTNNPPVGPACTASHCDTLRVMQNITCNAHFTHQSSNASGAVYFQPAANPPGTMYAWNFGDGTTSNQVNPQHNFMHSGSYWVCLTVTQYGAGTGNILCTSTWCDSIHVSITPPTCNAHFTTVQSSLLNGVRFIPAAAVSTTTQYAWDFGDGDTSSVPSPVHNYASPGAYLACLKVTQMGPNGILCTATWCDSVMVGVPQNCSAYFNAIRDSAVIQLYHFSAAPNTANTVYTWDFGDGTHGNGQNVSHQYAHGGRYTVCLTITTQLSNGQTCTDHFCRVVGIRPIPYLSCHARFFFRNVPGAVNTVAFNTGNFASVANHYTWDFGDGTTGVGPNPVHVYADTGLYNVCLIMVNPLANCSDTVCRMVHVGPIVLAPPAGSSDQENKLGQGNDPATSLSIYPNPLDAYSVISISNAENSVTLRIFDTTGRMVKEFNALEDGNYSITADQFRSGMYFFQAFDAKGSSVANGKIIVR